MHKPNPTPTILIIPGLRDHVADHWQTHLAHDLAGKYPVHTVEPLTENKLSCAARVQAIQAAVKAINRPFVAVAHSGGVIMFAHWARAYSKRPVGALLATPPDFDTPMPAGYPALETLRDQGWLPVPREPFAFPSLVVGSTNDPLSSEARAQVLAQCWGSHWLSLGAVGHLNPASGFGPWPKAIELLAHQLEAWNSNRNDGAYKYRI